MPRPLWWRDSTGHSRVDCFTAANTRVYIDVLQDIVDVYNSEQHRSIGIPPKDVTEGNERHVWETLYGKKKKERPRTTLRVGDRVRLSEKVRQFKKGYLPQWTEEVFVVKRVIPGYVTTYKVEEMDGTPLKGTFYV